MLKRNSISRFCHPHKVALFAAGISLLFVGSCSKSNSQRALLDYVPSSSYAVLAVDWKTVSKDPDLKRISKGADIEKMFTQLGVDGEMVKEFAVFGEPGGAAAASNGLIAKGSFDSAEIVDQLKRRGWAEEVFQGKRIHVNPEDNAWLGYARGLGCAISRKEDSFPVNQAFQRAPCYRTGGPVSLLQGKLKAAIPINRHVPNHSYMAVRR